MEKVSGLGTEKDMKDINDVTDVFTKGTMKKDPKLMASIWTEEGNVVSSDAKYSEGHQEIEEHFVLVTQGVTPQTKARWRNYRFRFITEGIAFVDGEISINNVLDTEGDNTALLQVSVCFTAVKKDGKWWIQDARFSPAQTSQQV